jgi:hypothetical protein
MVNIKKFLIIPVLIIAYVFFINFISQMALPAGPTGQSMGGGTVQTIGVGETISVSVTRPYFFGMVRLPVYSAAFGEIGWMHDIFTYFIIALTVIFIIQETKYKKKERGVKMAKKTSNLDLKSLGMPVVWGFVFALIAYILSGDASSIVIGLLVMYLEYKLRK